MKLSHDLAVNGLLLSGLIFSQSSAKAIRTSRDISLKPVNIGYVLFPTYTALDVFGPLEVLTTLSWTQRLNLYLIAETMEPVSTKFRSAAMNKVNSSFAFTVNPTHTFETARSLPLDVVLVPGGGGTRAPDLNNTISFVRNVYPSLQYMISVCTGAGILARAGVLDGRNATTNKLAWNQTVLLGPKTNWIAHARWISDGNVWTTSGVAAGIDGVLGWISHVWGEETAVNITRMDEYERHTDPSFDPFADINGAIDVPPQRR